MNYTDNLNLKKPAKGEYYDVKDFNDNADIIDETIKNLLDVLENNDYGYLPLTGGTMAGGIVFTSDGNISKDSNISYFQALGGKTALNGARLNLFGKDYGNNDKGSFQLVTGDGTNAYSLQGFPNKSLKWCNEDVITGLGGTINGKTLSMANGAGITGNNNNWTYITGNNTWESGARLGLYGTANGDASRAGSFSLRADDGNGNSLELIGRPNKKLTWAGNDIFTSAGGDLKGTIKSMLGTGGAIAQHNDGTNLGGEFYLFSNTDANFLGGFLLRARKSDGTLIDLIGKGDSTLTWAGKKVAANGALSMPSNNSISITAPNITPNTGSYNQVNGWYTAPADGWVIVKATATTTRNDHMIELSYGKISHRVSWYAALMNSILIPVKKGDVLTLGYINISAIVESYFVYAQSEV